MRFKRDIKEREREHRLNHRDKRKSRSQHIQNKNKKENKQTRHQKWVDEKWNAHLKKTHIMLSEVASASDVA